MALRVGLFGGTFDPVHIGHLAAARSFLNSGLLSELWILLAPFPPHKNSATHASYSHRLEMLKTAFSGFERTKILTIENELPQPSFTYRTLKHLKSVYPDKDFYFCIGEDSLEHFHTWMKYDKILEETDLLVTKRPGASHKKVLSHILNQSYFVEHEPIKVASSEIKERLKNGKSISNLVPEKVEVIIRERGLYC
jgi:nicotinate-nucleotide adenylyltransferase